MDKIEMQTDSGPNLLAKRMACEEMDISPGTKRAKGFHDGLTVLKVVIAPAITRIVPFPEKVC